MLPNMGFYWPAWGAAGLVFGFGGGLALRHACRQTQRRGGLLLDLGPLLATLMVLLGARLHPFLAAPQELIEAAQNGVLIAALSWGGQHIAGGLLLATAFLGLALPRLSRHGLGGLEILDSVAPTAGICMAIGRLGCLAAGCCFGTLCTGPGCITYPADSPAWWNHFGRGLVGTDTDASLAVHALPIYLAVTGLAASLAAQIAKRCDLPAGVAAAAFIATLCALRLFVEVARESILVTTIPGQTMLDLMLVALSIGFAGVRLSGIGLRGCPSG